MIHYVFEDEPDDILSKLFCKSYRAKFVENNFHYTCGNGNILKVVKNLLNNKDNKVAVFIDMIPGNKSCARI